MALHQLQGQHPLTLVFIEAQIDLGAVVLETIVIASQESQGECADLEKSRSLNSTCS